MTAKIIRGTEIGPVIREEIKEETIRLKEQHGIVPGLVTIIVGSRPGIGQLCHRKTENRQRSLVSIRSRKM